MKRPSKDKVEKFISICCWFVFIVLLIYWTYEGKWNKKTILLIILFACINFIRGRNKSL